MSEHTSTPEADPKISRREFLKTAASVTAAVGLTGLNLYLRTEAGRMFVKRILEGDFKKGSNIEIDKESQLILNLFNETVKKSIEKLGPIQQEAAKELVKCRNIVLAAAKKEWLQLKINLGIEEARGKTNISHNPVSERAAIEILLPNPQDTAAVMVRTFSHELRHVYQYIIVLNKFGFKSKETDEFVNQHSELSNDEYEMDAEIFGDLAIYLYLKTHPEDKNYSFLLDPQEVGIDGVGFTGYWLSRKKDIPQKLTDDLEYKWFKERYFALLDIATDVLSGKNQPPISYPSVRDSQVSEEFIVEARKYFVPCGWSEAIGLEMDPTEKNPFILRYFVLPQYRLNKSN